MQWCRYGKAGLFLVSAVRLSIQQNVYPPSFQSAQGTVVYRNNIKALMKLRSFAMANITPTGVVPTMPVIAIGFEIDNGHAVASLTLQQHQHRHLTIHNNNNNNELSIPLQPYMILRTKIHGNNPRRARKTRILRNRTEHLPPFTKWPLAWA